MDEKNAIDVAEAFADLPGLLLGGHELVADEVDVGEVARAFGELGLVTLDFLVDIHGGRGPVGAGLADVNAGDTYFGAAAAGAEHTGGLATRRGLRSSRAQRAAAPHAQGTTADGGLQEIASFEFHGHGPFCERWSCTRGNLL